MTVALGLVCRDGVVVAADSMGSSGNIAGHSEKVKALENLPVVWTGAGSVYVLEEVEQKLLEIDSTPEVARHFTEPDPLELRKILKSNVIGAMKACNASTPHANAPQGAIFFPTDTLFLGFSNGRPYFLEVAQDGQLNWHTDRGFYAIGSGGEFATVARALMEHHLQEGHLELDQGRQLAWRTVDTTIAVSSAGVGPPVQMAVADDHGARILGDDEIRVVREQVSSWKQFERDALRGKWDAVETEGEDPPQLEE